MSSSSARLLYGELEVFGSPKVHRQVLIAAPKCLFLGKQDQVFRASGLAAPTSAVRIGVNECNGDFSTVRCSHGEGSISAVWRSCRFQVVYSSGEQVYCDVGSQRTYPYFAECSVSERKRVQNSRPSLKKTL
jgi:hypothetical protein